MARRKIYHDKELEKMLVDSDSECDDSDESDVNAGDCSDCSDSNSEGENVSNEEDNIRDEEIIVDNWRKFSANDADFLRLPFTVPQPGIQIPNNGSHEKEVDFFGRFFSDELLNQIVSETNRFAAVKIQKNTPFSRYSIWSKWEEVQLEVMKAFLGVILNMALNPKPQVKDYFSRNWLDQMPFFTNVFSRARFMQIFWMLHLCPPSPEQPIGVTTRGSKVANVVDYINKKCGELFIPGVWLHISLFERH